MGIVIRQSFWGTLITYVGVAIGYINSLLLLPYFLDSESYGLLRLIQSNGMILIPLAVLGMNGSFIKFYPEFKDSKGLTDRIFSLQLVLIILASLSFTGLIYIFKQEIESFYADESSLYNQYIFASVIIFISQSLYSFFIAFLYSKHNTIFPNFLNEILLRILSTGLICLYGLGFISFPDLILLIALSYIITSLILYIGMLIKYQIIFDFQFYKIEYSWIKKFIKFGGYTMLVTTCTSIVLNISYPLTSSYIGLEANSILAMSIYIGTIIELPGRSMIQIITPILTQNFNNKNIGEIKKIFALASVNMGLIGGLFGIGIITNLDNLFSIIPNGESYHLGAELIIIICFAKFINMIGGISSTAIYYSDFYKINIFITILGAILMVALNVLLIPRYGILGAGWSILITTFVNQVIRYITLYVELKIRPFEKQHLLLLILGALVFLFATYLPSLSNPILDIGFKSIATTLVFVAIAFYLKISAPANEIILKGLRIIGLRKN